MTEFDHLNEELIAGLVMLDPKDPQVLEARAHAAACKRCEASWAHAAQILGMLDEAFERDLTPPPDLVRRGLQIEAEARATSELQSASTAQAPARPSLGVWVIAALAPLAGLLMAWLEIGESTEVQSALKCAGVELATAGAGLTGALLYARRGGAALMPPHGAVAAGVGALAGELYLHAACGNHHAVHLLWAHGFTVAVAAFLGAVAARMLAPLPTNA